MPRTRTSFPVLSSLVRALADREPSTLLRDLLADPALGDHVRRMSLGELFGVATTRKSTSGGNQRAASKSTAAKPGRKPSVSVRTAEGRAAYDARVLAAIKSIGAPADAETIRKHAGGDEFQLRAATKRLAQAKQVKVQGKARGTRYLAR